MGANFFLVDSAPLPSRTFRNTMELIFIVFWVLLASILVPFFNWYGKRLPWADRHPLIVWAIVFSGFMLLAFLI